MKRLTGFTLIELVGVIVIVSVGMVGVAKMFGNTNLGLARATDDQVVSQYAQECAERVLQTRRDYGMTSTRIATTMCDLPAITSYTRTLSLPANYTGTTATACPSGIVCRDATVTVCAGSVSPCPATATTSTVTLTLVSY